MIKRLATLALPAAMALAAVVWAPDDWRVTLFIGLFWFALAWGHGYPVSSNVMLLLGAGIWIALQPDVTAAFLLALLPMVLFSGYALVRAGRGASAPEEAEIALTIRARNPVGGRGAA